MSTHGKIGIAQEHDAWRARIMRALAELRREDEAATADAAETEEPPRDEDAEGST